MPLRRPLYPIGTYVEYKDGNIWELGLIQKWIPAEKLLYSILCLKDNTIVEMPRSRVRPSPCFDAEIVADLSTDMEENSQQIQVLDSPIPASQHLPDIPTNDPEIWDEKLIMELSQDMPDPTQPTDNVISSPTVSNERPHISVSQEPWKDSNDFINPHPMLPPLPKLSMPNVKQSSRFHKMTDAQVDALQAGSKSKNTHRSTQWGITALRGKNIFFVFFFIITCHIVMSL